MHFLIDENIPKELTSWLEERGHSVFCVAKGTSDDEIASLVILEKYGFFKLKE